VGIKRAGIDTRLTYYRRGGIAEYMRQLSGALLALQPPFELCTVEHFRAKERLSPRRLTTFTPCHHRFEGVALGTELLLRRLDLLHSPDFIPPRLGAKHYVITVHDLAFLLFQDIQTGDSLRYYAGQIDRAVRQADHIISVSEATKNDLVRLLNVPPEKISVIWEGVHPQFRPQEARYPGLDGDYLLFVGTIEPRKNIPNLVRGYGIARNQAPELPPLVIAGDKGWLWEESWQEMENLGEAVKWIGGVPFDKLPPLYSGAKILLYPSLYEGFGFPPLEAMACGTPALVSNVGALRETGGEAASYVEPNSPDSIAEGILRLWRDPDFYATQREKGFAHVRQFTWEAAARQTLEVYQRVLGD
jgi:glycosyltransferase involved in cell wall biosynthesis